MGFGPLLFQGVFGRSPHFNTHPHTHICPTDGVGMCRLIYIYIYIIYRSRLSRCQCLAHLFCFGPPGFVPPFGRPPVALAGVSGTNSSMEMVVWPLFMAYGILFAVSSKRGIKEAQTERKQSVLVDVELWKKTKTRRSYKDVNLSICKHVSLWGLTHQTVVCSDILK